MTGERLPGTLYCDRCPYTTGPNLQGGAYHHTLDNPGHFMTDCPPEDLVKDDLPVAQEAVARLQGYLTPKPTSP